MMKTGWATRIVAIVLLALSCGCVVGDCHDHGGCVDDSDSCGVCPHVCRCAVVENSSVDIIRTVMLLGRDEQIAIPQTAVTGIFRPPVLNA